MAARWEAVANIKMGTQVTGRKRIPNREKLTAEDDALSQIAREVSKSVGLGMMEIVSLCNLVSRAEPSRDVQQRHTAPKPRKQPALRG